MAAAMGEGAVQQDKHCGVCGMVASMLPAQGAEEGGVLWCNRCTEEICCDNAYCLDISRTLHKSRGGEWEATAMNSYWTCANCAKAENGVWGRQRVVVNVVANNRGSRALSLGHASLVGICGSVESFYEARYDNSRFNPVLTDVLTVRLDDVPVGPRDGGSRNTHLEGQLYTSWCHNFVAYTSPAHEQHDQAERQCQVSEVPFCPHHALVSSWPCSFGSVRTTLWRHSQRLPLPVHRLRRRKPRRRRKRSASAR